MCSNTGQCAAVKKAPTCTNCEESLFQLVKKKLVGAVFFKENAAFLIFSTYSNHCIPTNEGFLSIKKEF